MMVIQLKFSHALGLVVGLCSVLRVQGLWMGPMPGADGLVERAELTCSPGYVACGDAGCILESRCCNKDGGLNCYTGGACYTAFNTIDCYDSPGIAPSTARACYDYTATGCADNNGCFKCSSTAAPYCYTIEIQSASQTWLGCSSTPGISVVVPTPAAATVSNPTDSSIPGYTSSGLVIPGPTITNLPFINPPPHRLSNGAIAGIAAGAFIAIAVISVLAFMLFKKSKSQKEQTPPPPPPADMTYQQYPQYAQGTHQYPPPPPSTVSPVSYQEGYSLDSAMKSGVTARNTQVAELGA